MTDLAVRPTPIDRVGFLTERERDVLALLADGRSNVGIARFLGVTIRTVETHTSRIFTKLGLFECEDDHRRVQAALVHLRASSATGTP